MLRSQTISNLNEKKSMGLFTFKSKKSSSKDLHKLISEPKPVQKPQPQRRPLSASVSSVNLNAKYKESPKVSSSSRSPDKENIPVKKITLPHSRSEIALRSRASTPNMNRQSMFVSSSKTSSKRSSMLFAEKRANSTVSMASDMFESQLEPTHSISSEISQISPETIHTVDSLMDQTSIQFHDFETTISDYSSTGDEDAESLGKSSKSNKHRSTLSIGSITSRTIPEDAPVISSKLPIMNRKSLDFENLERSQLADLLNTNTNYFKSSISLLGNAVILTTTDSALTDTSFEHEVNDLNYWDVLLEEPYDLISI